MITININNLNILINGHAGYAEYGKDIVCASVSILGQNLINSIEKLTEDKIQYEIKTGYINLDIRNLSKTSRILVESFFIGIKDIEKSYPKYIKVFDKRTHRA